MALSRIISEIKRDIGWKSWFVHTSVHSKPPLKGGGSLSNNAIRFGMVSGFAGPFSLPLYCALIPDLYLLPWAVSHDAMKSCTIYKRQWDTKWRLMVTRWSWLHIVTLQWCSGRANGFVRCAVSPSLMYQVSPRLITVKPHPSLFRIGVMFLKRNSLLCSESSLSCSGFSTHLCFRRSFEDVTRINFRFRLFVTWSSPHGRDTSSHKIWCRYTLSSPDWHFSEIKVGGRRHLGFSGYVNLAIPTCW